jgi:NodT family efflux transporter outer membrane factor (OMF) lipoprotein
VKPELDTYDAGFDAVWELDIWGKNRQRVRIAQESIDEAYADYDDMRVSLSAEVARVYVGIRTTDQRLVSLRRVVSTMESFAEAARERHARGEAPVTDVKLAELLAGVSKAGIPELETARRQYENSLCVLLNKSPQSLDERLGLSAAIPTAPLESAVGIPADLLRRRPDVRAAEHAAAAQAARVGMAKASILPAFALFGGIGLASSTSSEFFDSDSVRGNYGALMNIDALINYPVSVQLVRIKDAQFQEALLRYQDTVLRANMEAENNIISFLRSQDKTEILKKNVRDANEAAELTLDAYREGKVIVSVPIDALSFLVTQEDQYCQWQGAAATDYVALYKALGGGWEPRIGQELLSEEIQERMKEQADWWSFTGKYDLRTDYVRPDRHNNPEE